MKQWPSSFSTSLPLRLNSRYESGNLLIVTKKYSIDHQLEHILLSVRRLGE